MGEGRYKARLIFYWIYYVIHNCCILIFHSDRTYLVLMHSSVDYSYPVLLCIYSSHALYQKPEMGTRGERESRNGVLTRVPLL